MPFNLGFGEILVIVVIALLVFGGRLPEVGRSLGRGMKEFKEGLKGTRPLDEDEEDDDEKSRDPEPDATSGQDSTVEEPEPASSEERIAPRE